MVTDHHRPGRCFWLLAQRNSLAGMNVSGRSPCHAAGNSLLAAVRVEITQFELRVGIPGSCSLALPHRSRSVANGHVVRKL